MDKPLALLSVLLGAVLGGATAVADAPPDVPSVTVPVYANANCPIMGKPASKALYADTEYGRVYVCCPPCIKKIQDDPKRSYDAAYPVTKKAGNTVCPVSGATLAADAPTVAIQGYEVGIARADLAAAARANAQVVLAKALDPAVVDVGNATCPITAKPVAANAFCLVGKDLVRLSSPKCVEDVKKDPAKALAAAKADAAKKTAK